MSRGAFTRAMAPAVVGACALSTVAAVAFTTAVPQVLSRENVQLTATITPGSATNWNADGIDKFYGINWSGTYGDTVVAPFRLVQFWQGPQNILTALEAAQSDGKPDVVVSSGRGAGNASAAISWLTLTNRNDPRLTDTFWILDNNVDRPNGGYAARYPFFALVGVNPIPVPNDLAGVQILDVGYQYAWNSSAPAYISNLPALLNAIIAYAYRYRQQDKLPIPEEILTPEGTLAEGASGYYIVRTDGTVERHDFAPGSKVTTVYVTFETDGLPMLQPIRDFGGDLGNAFADVVEPVLRVLVNASYTNNDPFADPSVYTPMQLVAPPQVWIRAAQQLPGAFAESWNRLQEHASGSTRKPLDNATTAPPAAEQVATVPDVSTAAPGVVDVDVTDDRAAKSPSRPSKVTADRTVRSATSSLEADNTDSGSTDEPSAPKRTSRADRADRAGKGTTTTRDAFGGKTGKPDKQTPRTQTAANDSTSSATE